MNFTMVTKPEFSNQLVLLGASNLTRGLATVLETAQLICGSPTRILVAAGHGRSYGVSSHFLFRSLPGISGCGLWNDLETGPKLPTFALLTDLGNDLAYEKSVDEITGWVLSCIERLAEYQARIIITALPLQNLERLTPTVFGLFRAMFFSQKAPHLATSPRSGPSDQRRFAPARFEAMHYTRRATAGMVWHLPHSYPASLHPGSLCRNSQPLDSMRLWGAAPLQVRRPRTAPVLPPVSTTSASVWI